MKYSNFKFSELKIGDHVFFSVRKVDNRQSYWQIVSLEKDGKVKVVLGGGNGEETMIDVSEIQFLRPA